MTESMVTMNANHVHERDSSIIDLTVPMMHPMIDGLVQEIEREDTIIPTTENMTDDKGHTVPPVDMDAHQLRTISIFLLIIIVIIQIIKIIPTQLQIILKLLVLSN